MKQYRTTNRFIIAIALLIWWIVPKRTYHYSKGSKVYRFSITPLYLRKLLFWILKDHS